MRCEFLTRTMSMHKRPPNLQTRLQTCKLQPPNLQLNIHPIGGVGEELHFGSSPTSVDRHREDWKPGVYRERVPPWTLGPGSCLGRAVLSASSKRPHASQRHTGRILIKKLPNIAQSLVS